MDQSIYHIMFKLLAYILRPLQGRDCVRFITVCPDSSTPEAFKMLLELKKQLVEETTPMNKS